MKVGLREKHKEGEKVATRVRSDVQEKSVAKAIGGQQTISSGSTPFSKGDCINKQWLIECKTKMEHSKSMSIKKEWLEKNKQEALFMCKKYNALAFNFGPNEINYYVIDEYLFQELIEYLSTKEGD